MRLGKLLDLLGFNGEGRIDESRKVLSLLRMTSVVLATALVLVAVLTGLLPVGFLVATSLLLGKLPDAIHTGWSSAAGDETRLLLVLAAACFIGNQLCVVVRSSLGDVVARRIDSSIRDRVMVRAMAGVDLAAVEDDDHRSLLADAGAQLEYSFATPGKAAVALVQVLSRYAAVLATVIAVSVAFVWWAGPLLAVAGLFHRVRSVRRMRQAAEPGPFDLRREADYFGLTVGRDAAIAKELRVFDLAGWVRARYEVPKRKWVDYEMDVRRSVGFPVPVIDTSVMFLAGAVVLVIAARAAAHNDLSVGALVLVMLAGVTLIQAMFVSEQDFIIANGLGALASLERFEQHAVELPASAANRSVGVVGVRPVRELTFAEVSFTYPGQTRPVLDRLNLAIDAGSSLAVVGANGAGKTTLVKLLCGLYEPSAGRICVDGVDLREFDRAEWQRRVAPIFQDFVRYELTAAVNIGFGAVDHLDDRVAIRDAAQRAGVLETLDGLRGGLDTILSSRYAGGVDLSGGQWQRVAMARALAAVNAGAGVLILDEPTANLDARAEVAFFERFLELTAGCTTVIVSHRFSTVRRADRIVVLEAGSVVEDGSHEELLALHGRYAHMFNLQARRFGDTAEESGTR